MILGDVGDARWEEVNVVEKGNNCGWNWLEADRVTGLPGCPTNFSTAGFTRAIWSYPHPNVVPGASSDFIGNAIIGGFVYQGTKYPFLNGKYICSDWQSGNVWAITLAPQVVVERIAARTLIHGFTLNPVTGDILVTDLSGIWALTPLPPVGVPQTLSATGFFSSLVPLVPNVEAIPYSVASPFWSDYALKTRWVWLPTGTQVTRDAADSWSFPTGTVWVKHFNLPALRMDNPDVPAYRLETRFLVKTAGGAYGLTYRWRANEAEADLVPSEGADAEYPVEDAGIVEMQPWHFPGRTECSTCHNTVAGSALGFSTRQLNVGDQLGQLSALGIFNPPFNPADLPTLPRLSRPDDSTATLEHRFKSYTDANCSYCHQPGGGGGGDWDARFSTPLADSRVVNGVVQDELGVPGSRVIAPGSLERSVLYRRLLDMTGPHAPAAYHMPPLATYQRNEKAVTLVASLVDSLDRKVWQIGTNSLVRATCGQEFSVENRLDDLAPGTLGLDDDFYTAGTYAAGFNGLTAPLAVAADEPWTNWERAHTHRDRANRVHFVAGTAGPATLTVVWGSGGWMTNGVTQSGFSSHNMVITHVAGGTTNTLWTGTVTQPLQVAVPFNAVAGANTISIRRTGPEVANTSYWLTYDSVLITK